MSKKKENSGVIKECKILGKQREKFWVRKRGKNLGVIKRGKFWGQKRVKFLRKKNGFFGGLSMTFLPKSHKKMENFSSKFVLLLEGAIYTHSIAYLE